MAQKRTSKTWESNPGIKVEKFNLDEVNEKNFANHLLVLKQEDITYSFMMNIFGNFNGKCFCNAYDLLIVPPNTFKYLDEKGKERSNVNKFTTTVGIWIFNIFFLQGFGFSRFFGGYLNETIRKKNFNFINQTLVYALLENRIEVEPYKQFLDYSQFFMPFETILSPNHTEAILTCTKKIEAMKKKLFDENKEELDKGNIVVAEKIEKQLKDYAKELLKGDPGLDPYDSDAGANFDNNFKNMYIMRGAIRDPDPDAKQQYNIASSCFCDGISAEEYSLICNSLAAGPYSRAKKTEIGGHWEKLFGAAFQTIILDEPGSDCKTDKYITIELTSKNIGMFMYNYIINSKGELEELTTDNMNKYLNKKVNMRFSIFCKSKTGICNKCGGNFFYRRGNRNIGLATVQIPSKLKNISMKSFHDGTVNTTEIEPMKAFGLKK